ncbi:hypothetical protein BBU118A_B18 (plasmid) [Borreliella burgdorferi 118a]|uniref:Uncharacterized protein n=1 Tax=Borreliella burgdorferi 118a TaxID=476210 RepID=A0A7U4DIY5_BORBG|nr:hypothetical protein BBU118A_B18 [Borreliella burgdorferi 118a]
MFFNFLFEKIIFSNSSIFIQDIEEFEKYCINLILKST